MISVCLFELALRRHTAEITACRFELENERSERRKTMAIEIKGLRSDALLARANIDRVRAAYARFNQAAPAHADDIDKLASDITGMQSDLEFAATVMGNYAGESEKLADTRGEKQVITAADVGKIDPELPVAVGEPSKLEIDAAAAGVDPMVYRAFETGLPLSVAHKVVNGS